MSFIVHRSNKPYFPLRKEPVLSRLSLEAKGLFALLSSFNGAGVSRDSLKDSFLRNDSEETVNSALSELINSGYIIKEPANEDLGDGVFFVADCDDTHRGKE